MGAYSLIFCNEVGVTFWLFCNKVGVRCAFVPKNWEQIAQKLKDCTANKNWEHLCKQTDYWREKALDYKYRYELAEFEGIYTALLDAWNTIEPDNLRLNTSSDDYCLLYITKDDLSYLRLE